MSATWSLRQSDDYQGNISDGRTKLLKHDRGRYVCWCDSRSNTEHALRCSLVHSQNCCDHFAVPQSRLVPLRSHKSRHLTSCHYVTFLCVSKSFFLRCLLRAIHRYGVKSRVRVPSFLFEVVRKARGGSRMCRVHSGRASCCSRNPEI